MHISVRVCALTRLVRSHSDSFGKTFLGLDAFCSSAPVAPQPRSVTALCLVWFLLWSPVDSRLQTLAGLVPVALNRLPASDSGPPRGDQLNWDQLADTHYFCLWELNKEKNLLICAHVSEDTGFENQLVLFYCSECRSQGWRLCM